MNLKHNIPAQSLSRKVKEKFQNLAERIDYAHDRYKVKFNNIANLFSMVGDQMKVQRNKMHELEKRLIKLENKQKKS